MEKAPELPPEAVEDLCRFLGEYYWEPQLASKVLRRRYGIECKPLDLEYIYAVQTRGQPKY